MVAASVRARSRSVMKAPVPTFTSNSNDPVPSAIFFDMIELTTSGIDSTVAVMSRNAYRRRSAGTISALAAVITHPTSSSTASTSSGRRSDRQPAMASILSRVPPVWPSPRPDIWGTTAPNTATRGTSTREILSPTPPVECLSTVGRPRLLRSIRVPEAIMASVHTASSLPVMPRHRMAINRAAICSSANPPPM